MGTLFPQLASPLRILNKKQKTVDFSRAVMYIIVDIKKREKLLLLD
jgi:hypothetical protein